MRIAIASLALAVTLTPAPPAIDKITKETITSEGKTRTYYLLVPERATTRVPAPLLVLLHGSGRNGKSLVEPWQKVAKQEGIILVGPDALDSNAWFIPADGPDFIHELVESLRGRLAIDPRRIYLFGHSGGAIQALYLSILESEYFAATAIHAGALPEDGRQHIDEAFRKIPIGMWVGTDDPFFPLRTVRATRDAFAARGFEVSLTEIKFHTHDYYSKAFDINPQVWTFLAKHELPYDPKYQTYSRNP